MARPTHIATITGVVTAALKRENFGCQVVELMNTSLAADAVSLARTHCGHRGLLKWPMLPVLVLVLIIAARRSWPDGFTHAACMVDTAHNIQKFLPLQLVHTRHSVVLQPTRDAHGSCC